MGSYRFDELARLRPQGHSHPIGTVERRRKLTATLSFLNSSGDVEFGKEANIEQEFAWCQLPPEPGSTEHRVWTGFEVHTRDPELKNSTLVIATHPYSTDWFDWADFKPILRRGREERLRPLRATEEQVRRKLRSRHDLATENLEARPGWLTARLSLPTRTKGLAITSRARLQTRDVWNAFESALNGRYSRNVKSDLWCFGACEQFERCREMLRVSQQAMHLLDKTDDGTLFENRKRVGRGPARKLGPVAKSLRREVLESSIIKALSGKSPQFDRLLAKKERPLASILMAWIYEDTMYNLVKRLNEPEADSRVDVQDFGNLAAQDEYRETSFDEMVETFYDGFRKRKLTQEFRCQIEKELAAESDERRIAACAALVAADRIGYRLQRSFIPLLRAIAGDEREHPEAWKAARTVLKLLRGDDPPSD